MEHFLIICIYLMYPSASRQKFERGDKTWEGDWANYLFITWKRTNHLTAQHCAMCHQLVASCHATLCRTELLPKPLGSNKVVSSKKSLQCQFYDLLLM